MKSFIWVIAIFINLLGLFLFFYSIDLDNLLSKETPNFVLFTAAACCAIIPYCFARAFSFLYDEQVNQDNEEKARKTIDSSSNS